MDAMAEHTASGRRITISSVVSGADVEVSVHDTGPGLPAELAGRLFTPFATTKPHGARDWPRDYPNHCRSSRGQHRCAQSSRGGAIFTVTLPASDAHEIQLSKPELLPARASLPTPEPNLRVASRRHLIALTWRESGSSTAGGDLTSGLHAASIAALVQSEFIVECPGLSALPAWPDHAGVAPAGCAAAVAAAFRSSANSLAVSGAAPGTDGMARTPESPYPAPRDGSDSDASQSPGGRFAFGGPPTPGTRRRRAHRRQISLLETGSHRISLLSRGAG